MGIERIGKEETGHTFVHGRSDVEDERELACKICRVEMREAYEDLVPVDALDGALEVRLTCGDCGAQGRSVCIEDILFSLTF